MQIRQETSIRQIQTISPQFILAQHVLQLTILELNQKVQQELDENPALEIEEVTVCPFCHRTFESNRCEHCGQRPGGAEDVIDRFVDSLGDYDPEEAAYEYSGGGGGEDAKTPIIDMLSSQGTFHDLVFHSFLGSNYPERLRDLAEFMIFSMDDDGFLSASDEEMTAQFVEANPELDESERPTPGNVTEIRSIIKALDPIGVGTRGPQEALLLQLEILKSENKVDPWAETVVHDYFDDFLHARFNQIAESLNTSHIEIQRTREFIQRNLNPYPGRSFICRMPDPVQFIKPSIAIYYDGQKLTWEILELNDYKLRLNPIYMQMYRENGATEKSMDKSDYLHIRDYFRRAKQLLDNISIRRSTLEKIAEALCREQRDFLIKGLHYIRPLTQSQIADMIGLHESTISRAMSGKYVLIPSGELLSFDFFFNASLRPKEYIRNIILAESTGRPIADADICKLLIEKGIHLARRTVTKYREEMNIPSSYQRKRARIHV